MKTKELMKLPGCLVAEFQIRAGDMPAKCSMPRDLPDPVFDAVFDADYFFGRT